MATSPEPAIIKRYGDRGSYVTLQDLAVMVEDDEAFVVYEARTGEDITRSILKQIIFQRAKHG
jgi:polyhydroxyalkanoate synthesis regulator protein